MLENIMAPIKNRLKLSYKLGIPRNQRETINKRSLLAKFVLLCTFVLFLNIFSANSPNFQLKNANNHEMCMMHDFHFRHFACISAPKSQQLSSYWYFNSKIYGFINLWYKKPLCHILSGIVSTSEQKTNP